MNISKLNQATIAWIRTARPSMATKFIKMKNAQGCDLPCYTQRVSRSCLTIIPYPLIVKNNLTIAQLETFTNGVCIQINWNCFKSMYDKSQRSKLEEYCVTHVGSDAHVSCVVTLFSKETEGSASSQSLVHLNEFQKFIKEQRWRPTRRKSNKFKRGTNNKGNDKWCGHYMYQVQGGSNTNNACSHSKKDASVGLFTIHKGFATDEIMEWTRATLLWQFLHIKELDTVFTQAEIETNKRKYEEALSTKMYFGKTCLELIDSISSTQKIIRDGYLFNIIDQKHLTIDDFDSLEVTHNEAVSKEKLYFDETTQLLLSDFRPGNVFLCHKTSNMRQQELTVDEWIEYIRDTFTRLCSKTYHASV